MWCSWPGSDVPWIPAANRPSPGARIYVLDIDPIKEQMTLWHVPAARYARADLATALRQVTASLRERGGLDAARVTARAERLAAVHRAQREHWAATERPAADGTVTAEYLVACVREAIGHDAHRAHRGDHQLPRRLRAPAAQPAGIAASAAAAARWAGPAARRSAPSSPPPTAPW